MMNFLKKHQALLLGFLTFFLWMLSTVAAFLIILPVLDSILLIYAAFWADPTPFGQAYYLGTTIRQISVMVLAVIFTAGIIGGGELHARNLNTPLSWHFMFLTYAVLLTLFLFTIFF